MAVAFADVSSHWSYSLEEVIGLIFVLGVVGAYSTLFAFTRRPRWGWTIAATIALLGMTVLISISPREGPPRHPAEPIFPALERI